MLSTASGRPARSSTGADTPYSEASSSPAHTPYPRARVAASSAASSCGSVIVVAVNEVSAPLSTRRTCSGGRNASSALPVDVACTGTERPSQLAVTTAAGVTSST